MQTTLFRLFITFVLVPGLLAGCIVIDLHGSGFKTVKGSGEVISETRQVTDFDSIKLEGPGKVIVTRGKIQSLVIREDRQKHYRFGRSNQSELSGGSGKISR